MFSIQKTQAVSVWAFWVKTLPFFCKNMKASTNPPIANAARGEAILTIDGEKHFVKFNLRVLYAWTQLTGKAPSEFGLEIDENHIGALSGILLCAVRLFVPGKETYTQEEAMDLMQDMNAEEAEGLADAIILAVTPDPLTAALRKQVAAKAAAKKAENKSGADTSISV